MFLINSIKKMILLSKLENLLTTIILLLSIKQKPVLKFPFSYLILKPTSFNSCSNFSKVWFVKEMYINSNLQKKAENYLCFQKISFKFCYLKSTTSTPTCALGSNVNVASEIFTFGVKLLIV